MKQFTEKISIKDVVTLFKPRYREDSNVRGILFLVGILLTPITLAGALWFYIRSYNRHLKPNYIKPELDQIPIITRVSMVIGGVFIWIFLFIFLKIVYFFLGDYHFSIGFILGYLLVTSVLTFGIMYRFNQWRITTIMEMEENTRFGTAGFADLDDYADLMYNPSGIYIGNINMKYNKQGHVLTVAGTRSGKFTNLIASNLLGLSDYSGSWVVIDIKGESAAVTADYQRSIGNNVVILNPWNLNEVSSATYNPLDLIDINDEESLIDDSSIIAQMIVPDQPGDKDPYWRNRARSMITGMVIHLMLSKENKTLTKIWQWLRLSEDKFADLLSDMSISENETVRGVANEVSGIKASDRAYGSIMSSAQDATDFLKSPALQRSLESSSFNINELSKGETTLYVVIPADKLESQSQWLRLVVTTSLLSVVRNKDKQVTFVLDEFASLGNMKIVEQYMGLSAGYNISLWPIFQNLTQIKTHYGESWETFIGNAAVRHYFGINDNFTADYVSNSFGYTTFSPRYYKAKDGPQRSQRALITPDELKRMSDKNIFIQVEQRRPYYFGKVPYFIDPDLIKRAKDNPYSPFPLG